MLGFQELGQLMQNVPVTVKRKASGGEEMTGDEPVTAIAGGKVENMATPVAAHGGGGGKKKKAKNKR